MQMNPEMMAQRDAERLQYEEEFQRELRERERGD